MLGADMEGEGGKEGERAREREGGETNAFERE